jgi:tetratricopeptide (TPR) repeat protein
VSTRPEKFCLASIIEEKIAMPFRAWGKGGLGHSNKPLPNVLPTRSPALASTFSQALALHQAGRLAEAERNYLQILKVQPNQFDCLHLLGVIVSQRGNHAEAVRQIDVALKINPKAAPAHYNRGNVLRELKRFDEALASYKSIAPSPLAVSKPPSPRHIAELPARGQ